MKQTYPPTQARHRAAFVLALPGSALLASLGTSIANVALPTLSEVFAAPFAQIQAVIVAYLATMTVAVVAAGRLGDRFGMKRILVTGLGMFAAASALGALAGNLGALTSARALQGIGGAFMMTTSMALMRQNAEDKQVGRAMGLLGTVSALGTALGPSLGGLLIASFGWRSLFWVQALLAGGTFVLAWLTVPDRARPQASAERRGASLDRHLMPHLLTNGMVSAVMMATLVVGPFYLSLGLGLPPSQVGLVMAAGPLVSIASGVPCGRLVDAWGHRRTVVGGLGLMLVGLALLASLPTGAGTIGYVAAIVILTPGYQLFQAANNTAALVGTPQEQRGAAAGWLGFSRNLGLIAGAWMLGALFASATSAVEFASAEAAVIAQAMRQTFLAAAGLVALAFGIAWRPRLSRQGAGVP